MFRDCYLAMCRGDVKIYSELVRSLLYQYCVAVKHKKTTTKKTGTKNGINLPFNEYVPFCRHTQITVHMFIVWDVVHTNMLVQRFYYIYTTCG